jgi:hypothetical protein
VRNSLSVLLLTVSGATAALGQTTPAQTVVMAAPQIAFSTGYAGAIMAPFGMTPVTGKPYSGEEVSESVQTLADGTHINQTMTLQKIYRDSQGRMRMERPLMHPGMGGPPVPADAPMIIDITDPVAHVRYSLDTRGKIAHRWESPTPGIANARGGFAAMLSPSLPTVTASMPQVIPQSDPSRPHSQFEKLDPQTIDGIVVEGRRTTTTYPTGSVGNDREFVTTSEMWTSPELNVMVLISKNSDPRNGEHTQKLINISRDKPDGSLFQLPADYEVAEEKGPVSLYHRHRSGANGKAKLYKTFPAATAINCFPSTA